MAGHPNRMMKKSASLEKAEVKVEAEQDLSVLL
jgi:hypothetical protein